MMAPGAFGMGPGPRRARFSWRVFGLVLLVIVVVLAGLAITRMCAGWDKEEAQTREARVVEFIHSE